MKTILVHLIIFTCVAQSLKAQEPQTFETMLKRDGVARIIREERTRFTEQLISMTALKPVFSDSFDANVVDHIVTIQLVQPASPTTAEKTLRVRFRLFLGNMTTYLLATKKEVSFNDKSLESYLDAAALAGRCGESPCPRGCAKHNPCDESCNPCSTQHRGRW